jgi:hypothetical protein
VSEPEVITERDVRGVVAGGPRAIREAGGWSRLFDSLGDGMVGDLAAVRTGLFEKAAGGLALVSWCIHCPKDRPTKILLPLEGLYEDPDDDPVRPLAGGIFLERGYVSVFALKVAQRMACEPCTDRLEREDMKRETKRATDGRVSEAGVPAGLVEKVTKDGLWDGLIVDGRTPDETKRRREAIEQARDWAGKKRPGRGLLIWGPPGAGKTHLAALMALERLKHSPIRWVSVGVLMAELQGAWNDQDRVRALRVLTSASVAVLDDFDKVASTESKLTQLFTALDKREQARTPLVVTTNMKPSDLREKLGTVIVSRLLGMCNVVEYPGADHRLSMGTGS